ncbi:pyruvate dehydrogenase kinase [Cordyceps fumosorosea ARSEF 2679]|uniref:Protein-serine/threonine kinase n=1 Tax=Cordyceps fumosorosea (strain ARSEF 2679) TaxID=1081104 RepID=A0A162ID33_CORFA|nr:pyruvate dehydrogenase kinase [Cordyceps fumosorosea ARSEF 2679]OAA55445.1 pyruvate dehydrogenase kinase [Cordyceps fumosorosea ARSEF 2679]
MLSSSMRHTRPRKRLIDPLARTATAALAVRVGAAPRPCPMAGRGAATAAAAWRPVSVLDEWVAREARPISLRQLMVFGRSLTESRLISSANYVRTELPSRIAHRLRDMQQLPYVVVTNPHINDVYNLYYNAFDTFRKIKEIKTLEDNDRLCEIISQNLKGHLTVIPKLAMGILECGGLMNPKDLDKFMNTILRSRISRRVIAEQHLSLTETYHSPHFSPGAKLSESDFIGEVFIKCQAREVIERCARAVTALARSTNGPDAEVPEVRIDGHLNASFPYILSHLEYIIGELLRNSVQAVVDRQARLREKAASSARALVVEPPPPIEVTICEAQEHVIIRISDRGGGIPREELPYLWSFSKGPQSAARLANLGRVPRMAATMQELHIDELGRADLKAPSYPTPPPPPSPQDQPPSTATPHTPSQQNSLSSLTSRPPNLRLGMGLPLSRVYAEYWAGSLHVHSLEGYGVDAFLQISRLGNKNEQLTTRASMDAV